MAHRALHGDNCFFQDARRKIKETKREKREETREKAKERDKETLRSGSLRVARCDCCAALCARIPQLSSSGWERILELLLSVPEDRRRATNARRGRRREYRPIPVVCVPQEPC